MRHSAFTLVAFIASAGLAACGAAASPSIEGGPAPVQQSHNPTLITAEELSSAAPGDLYTAIDRLRPAFFQTRGSSSFGNGAGPEVLKVYVENVARGDVSTLRDINASDVQEVRRLSASEATQRFGTGNTLGAIVVTLKKR
jgi:hypothetical protein